MKFRILWGAALCAAACGLTTCAGSAKAQEQRSWSDITGRNKLEAAYVSHDDKVVKLKSADGKTFEIEILKLSVPDRAYLINLDAANPFKPAGGNPFQPSASPFQPVEKSADPNAVRAAAPPKNLKHGKRILLEAPKNGWAYAPPPPVRAEFEPRKVVLPEQEFYAHFESFAVSRDGTHVVATSRNSSTGLTTLLLVDMRAGEVAASLTAVEEFDVAAIDDAGRRIAVLTGPRTDRNTIVGIYRRDGNALVPEAQFVPFSDVRIHNSVRWLTFSGDSRLAALNDGGRFSVWDLVALREECYLDLEPGTVAAGSVDTNIVALACSKVGVLFDVSQEKILGAGGMPNGIVPGGLAFSAAGDRLAIIGTARVVIADMQTGAPISDFEIPGFQGGNALFVHDNYLLLGDSLLVELENRMLLWSYSGGKVGRHVGAAGYTYFLVEGSGRHPDGILPLKLPDNKALAALDAALTNPESFAVRPNMTVRLDVSKIPAQHQALVRDSLTKALALRQITVGPSSPVNVICSIEGPKPRELTYHTFGQIGNSRVTMQEFTSTIDIQYEGRTAWLSRTSNGVPHSINRNDGESLQQAVNRLTSQPNLSIFESITVPKFVPVPPKGGSNSGSTVGSSMLSLNDF